jgi:hypothetical protein
MYALSNTQPRRRAMTKDISTDIINFYQSVKEIVELTAENLLGVSPPMNVKLESTASFIDAL